MYDNYNEKQPEDKENFKSRYWKEDEKPNNLYVPTNGETIHSWLAREGNAVFQSRETNIATHINNGKRVWWTHRSAGNCFMCDDITHVKILYECLEQLKELIDLKKYEWHFQAPKVLENGLEVPAKWLVKPTS